MKLIAIGDFHGKLPLKLKAKIKKENPDIILCTGDFANADKIRKIIFKNWTDKPWYEVVGLKKAKKMERESFDSGLNLIKEINSLNKKTFIIWGNTDFYKSTLFKGELSPGFYENKIKKLKNIKLIEKKKIKPEELNVEIVGHGGYLDVTEYIKSPIHEDIETQEKVIKRYKKAEFQLNKLFNKTHPKKGFIFLIHYPPYKFFDKVDFKSSPMHGKHVCFAPYNKIIKKYQPSLVICGHMHEHQGMKTLGKTKIIAHGPASEGKAAIIEIDKSNKTKVRFIK